MEARINDLEEKELHHGPHGIGIEGYTELLAYYIFSRSAVQRKVPVETCSTMDEAYGLELEAVWNVGKRLWEKDMAAFYQAVGAFHWTHQIGPVIDKLIESVREKTIRLIGTAYSSIRPEDVATMLGLTLPEVEQMIIGGRLSGGWRIQDGMIIPNEIPQGGGGGVGRVGIRISGDEQIAKLTDYVAFLEK